MRRRGEGIGRLKGSLREFFSSVFRDSWIEHHSSRCIKGSAVGSGIKRGKNTRNADLPFFLSFFDSNQPIEANGQPHSRKIGPAFSERVYSIWTSNDPAEVL